MRRRTWHPIPEPMADGTGRLFTGFYIAMSPLADALVPLRVDAVSFHARMRTGEWSPDRKQLHIGSGDNLPAGVATAVFGAAVEVLLDEARTLREAAKAAKALFDAAALRHEHESVRAARIVAG